MPVEEAGWYAHATFKGARIKAQDHRSPSAAALDLAEKLLAGGQCRCGQRVTLTDDHPGCRWRLMGKRWEPGCDAPSVHIDGPSGDLGAMKPGHAPSGGEATVTAARLELAWEFDVAVSTHDWLRKRVTTLSYTRVTVLAEDYWDASMCAIQLAECAPGDTIATDVLWRY